MPLIIPTSLTNTNQDNQLLYKILLSLAEKFNKLDYYLDDNDKVIIAMTHCQLENSWSNSDAITSFVGTMLQHIETSNPNTITRINQNGIRIVPELPEKKLSVTKLIKTLYNNMLFELHGGNAPGNVLPNFIGEMVKISTQRIESQLALANMTISTVSPQAQNFSAIKQHVENDFQIFEQKEHFHIYIQVQRFVNHYMGQITPATATGSALYKHSYAQGNEADCIKLALEFKQAITSPASELDKAKMDAIGKLIAAQLISSLNVEPSIANTFTKNTLVSLNSNTLIVSMPNLPMAPDAKSVVAGKLRLLLVGIGVAQDLVVKDITFVQKQPSISQHIGLGLSLLSQATPSSGAANENLMDTTSRAAPKPERPATRSRKAGPG